MFGRSVGAGADDLEADLVDEPPDLAALTNTRSVAGLRLRASGPRGAGPVRVMLGPHAADT